MITSQSSVNVKNSTFSDNTAMLHGAVMIRYRDSFSISGTTFATNSAGGSNGVMTYESIFSITDSTFRGNAAERYSGVIYAGNGSLTISSSTFADNSAALAGGVISTFSGSSFNITSSTLLTTVQLMLVVSCSHLIPR